MKPKRELTPPISLFQHIKRDEKDPKRFINLTDIDNQFRKKQIENNIHSRSKSSDVKINKLVNENKGKFNKRIVYINGVRTEKFIYSKNNKTDHQKSPNVEKKIENEKIIKENIPKISLDNINNNNLNDISINETDEVDKSINKSGNKENTTESESKKKYKIITVPQTQARVIQEGGLRFSNVKPITIIQQGNFALSSSRSKNKSENLSSQNIEKSEKSENIENIEKKSNNPSVPKKRIISYQEYRRRIQKTLDENKKVLRSPTPEQTKLKLINGDDNSKPKTLIEQYNDLSRDRSVDVRGKEVYKPTQNPPKTIGTTQGPIITRLTRTLSKPFLEIHKENSSTKKSENTHKYLTENIQKKEKDNMDSLVKKISNLNKNQVNPKSKTIESISLNTLIRQVNQEVRFPQNNNKSINLITNTSNRFSKNDQIKNQIFGHKKNKTMYNINQTQNFIQNDNNIRIRPGSSYNNHVPLDTKQKSIPKKHQIEYGKNFTRSSQRDYKKKNGGYNYVLGGNKSPKNEIKTGSKKQEQSHVKIYTNNGPSNTFYPNNYKASSRKKIDEVPTDRLSYQRRGWKAVLNSPGTLKQSNSVTKLSTNIKGNFNVKSNSVYKTTKDNYSINKINANLNNLKNQGSGNVTTTIRRYTVAPPPKSMGYRFEGRNTQGDRRNFSRTKISSGIDGNKKQIFTNFNELKKNLKTNFYNQN